MADKTITQLTATTSAATADEIPIWVAGSAVTRKITKANFLQGAFTGGGTVATGGFTLTVPATGTAALIQTGSWTPTLLGTGSNPTVTYTTQTGKYTKIGDVCLAFFSLTTSAFSGGTGNIMLGGLPFTCGSGIGYNAITGKLTLSAGYTQMGIIPIVGNSRAYLIQEKTATDSALIPLTAWSTTSYASGVLIYVV